MIVDSTQEKSLALEYRRKQAIRFLRDAKLRPVDVARALGVSRAAVSMWWSMYCKRGEDGLRYTVRTGRHPRLSKEQLTQVESALRRGGLANGFPTDRWSARRVAVLIERETGVRYHPDHVGKLARAFGWHPWWGLAPVELRKAVRTVTPKAPQSLRPPFMLHPIFSGRTVGTAATVRSSKRLEYAAADGSRRSGLSETGRSREVPVETR